MLYIIFLYFLVFTTTASQTLDSPNAIATTPNQQIAQTITPPPTPTKTPTNTSSSLNDSQIISDCYSPSTSYPNQYQ